MNRNEVAAALSEWDSACDSGSGDAEHSAGEALAGILREWLDRQ